MWGSMPTQASIGIGYCISYQNGAWLEFYYHWGLMFSQPGVGAAGEVVFCPDQGIIELAPFQVLPAHLVFPSEAQATSTHLAEGGGGGWGGERDHVGY